MYVRVTAQGGGERNGCAVLWRVTGVRLVLSGEKGEKCGGVEDRARG